MLIDDAHHLFSVRIRAIAHTEIHSIMQDGWIALEFRTAPRPGMDGRLERAAIRMGCDELAEDHGVVFQAARHAEGIRRAALSLDRFSRPGFGAGARREPVLAIFLCNPEQILLGVRTLAEE